MKRELTNKAFEERLEQLRPNSVSERLQRRLEASISERTSQSRRQRWQQHLRWISGLAAALVVLAAGFRLLIPESEPSLSAEPVASADGKVADQSGGFEPVVAENLLQERIDEGIVFLNNGAAARKYRYEFIDRVVWKNPADGSTMEIEVPREEVVMVPVQTF